MGSQFGCPLLLSARSHDRADHRRGFALASQGVAVSIRIQGILARDLQLRKLSVRSPWLQQCYAGANAPPVTGITGISQTLKEVRAHVVRP
jgi:hypothetical protein